ncbi:MAG: prolyl oligopeptidase family serine peptidase [Balneolaceae bacterium]
MKKKILLSLLVVFVVSLNGLFAISPPSDGEYGVVIEGYDWGPAVSKVILSLEDPVTSVNRNDYKVMVQRSSDCSTIPPAQVLGSRRVITGYVSDSEGSRLEEGNHITLVLAVAPNQPMGSPIQYSQAEGCSGNNWIDYDMTIRDEAKGMIWNEEVNRIMPIIDRFDLSGKFSDGNGITMSYATFSPESSEEKSPLIIWLHGGGEGGVDPTIPLVANKAANYASDEIQAIFDGAHVLVPQTPTRWMDSGEGTTTGQTDDIYYEAVKALIDDYISGNHDVDRDRIYVGGASNGAYLTLKMIIEYPDFFAAAFPSALAYGGSYFTDEQTDRIKNIPIWFIHSKDDGTTVPDETVIPVYNKLKEAGAPNVHFSYFDHVVDITGFMGGDGYHYPGHWSWIYSHENEARRGYDGNLVKLDGRPVTIMEWMAGQSK